LRDKREKYHHSLKALAIREKKIHIVGSPELKIEGTPVYLDVEGLPDRDFYYLIGMRIGNDESAVQHSLWADAVEDEGKIWGEFLAIVETIKNPVLIHYGSYETDFIKRMRTRYGTRYQNSSESKDIGSFLNLLSFIYAQIYFPSFSTGLKDIAGFFGFTWTDADFTGLQSIVSRSRWEDSHDHTIKERLVNYNTQDCQALELVTQTLSIALDQKTQGLLSENLQLQVTRADDLPSIKSKWRTFTSPVAAFEAINKAAQ
jgi:predicted RecB family nuclease